MTEFDDQVNDQELTQENSQPRPPYDSWEDGATSYIDSFRPVSPGSGDGQRWIAISIDGARYAAAEACRDIIHADVDALNMEFNNALLNWAVERLEQMRADPARARASYRAFEARTAAERAEFENELNAAVQDGPARVTELCRLIGTSERPSTLDPMDNGTVAIVVPQIIRATHKEWIAEDRLVIGGAGRANPTLIVPSLSGRLCIGSAFSNEIFKRLMGWTDRAGFSNEHLTALRALRNHQLAGAGLKSGLKYNAIPACLLTEQHGRTHNLVVLNVITTSGGAYNGSVDDFCTGGTPVLGVEKELIPVVSSCVNAASPEVQTRGRIIIPSPPGSWLERIIDLLPLIQTDGYPIEAAINQLCKVPVALYQGGRSWTYMARRVKADRSVELVRLDKHSDEPDWSTCTTARTIHDPNASTVLEDGQCPSCGYQHGSYPPSCVHCEEYTCQECSYSCVDCGDHYICNQCYRDGHDTCNSCGEACPHCDERGHDVWECSCCNNSYCDGCHTPYRCHCCQELSCLDCTFRVAGDAHCTACVENSDSVSFCECCSEYVYADDMTHCENCEVATCDDCWTGERCECGRTYCEDCAAEEAVYKCDNCDITGCGCPGCDEVKEMTTLNGEQVFLHDACCGEWEALRNERVISLGDDQTEQLPFAA